VRRRSLERPRNSWEDNINLDIQEVGWEVHGLDCSVLVEDRNRWRSIVNVVLKIRVP
jgi:hypothetical protein